MRRCSRCGRLLNDDMFYKCGSGLQSWCKDCFEKRNSEKVKTKPRGKRVPPPDKDSLIELYVNKGMPCSEVAKHLSISRFKVWFWLKQYCVERRGVVESRVLSVKNGYREPLKGRTRGPMPAETKALLKSIGLERNKHTPGYRKTSNGYYEYTRGDNKGRVVHDVIMESVIGRPLRHDEVVHHINGIRTDNRIENLELMTRAEHTSLHRKLKNQNNG